MQVIAQKSLELKTDTIEWYSQSLVFKDQKDSIITATRFVSEFCEEFYTLKRQVTDTVSESLTTFIYYKETKEMKPFKDMFIFRETPVDTIEVQHLFTGNDLTIDTFYFGQGMRIVPRGEHDLIRLLKHSFWSEKINTTDELIEDNIQYSFEVSHTHDVLQRTVMTKYCQLIIYVNKSPMLLTLHCVNSDCFGQDNEIESDSAILRNNHEEKEIIRMLNRLDKNYSAYCLNNPPQNLIKIDAFGRKQQFFIAEEGYPLISDKRIKPVFRLHYLFKGLVSMYFEN